MIYGDILSEKHHIKKTYPNHKQNFDWCITAWPSQQ